MIKRKYWISRIKELWQKKPVIWLSGVRRVGKTCLCQSLENVVYFDCELPRVRRQIEGDPESFLESLEGRNIVLDEIHRLGNPAEVLKIAADHYKTIKIIATGSSTLGASRKFKDTLAGRKLELWLSPMLSSDLDDFGCDDLSQRFLSGGLPSFFLAKESMEKEFQEWADAYWAKDILELFRLERRHSFQRFMELLFAQSGGIFEATAFAGPCEISRTSVSNYLAVLDATYVVSIVRPFSKHLPNEIVSAPRVYGFDTGFICYSKGWGQLRDEDKGLLWEHYVLNEMQGYLQRRDIRYWRDKQGHEVDFIVKNRGQSPVAIECKWAVDRFSGRNMKAFRRKYPEGDNYVVAHDVTRSFTRRIDNATKVKFLSLRSLMAELSKG